MRVIVAIDGTSGTRELLAAVAARPWTKDSEFMVLHVLEGLPTDVITQVLESGRLKKLKDKYENCTKSMVDSAAAFLSEHLPVYHAVHKVLTSGRVVETIVRIATDWSADMIVVGCHHRGLAEKLFMGSVAEGLISYAPCSVEILRPETTLGRGHASGATQTIASQDAQ